MTALSRPVLDADDVRVVVDAQIVLSMFLVRRDRPTVPPTQRALLPLLTRPSFHWLWSPDILTDYARGASAIEQDERLMRRAAFDRAGLTLLMGALRLAAPVNVSATSLRDARRQIEQAPLARHRDLDDAIYAACAVDGGAHVLSSNDGTLLALGPLYKGVWIVDWRTFVTELRTLGLIS